MPSPNLYAALNDTDSDHSGNEHREEVRNGAEFNLRDLETKHGEQPVFTHEILQKIANQVRLIRRQHVKQYLHSEKNTAKAKEIQAKLSETAPFQPFQSLSYTQRDGKSVTIWEDPGIICEDVVVEVNYMTRAEIHTKFQARFGEFRIKVLRELNEVQPGEEDDLVFSVPYYLESYPSKINNNHLNARFMANFRQNLKQVQNTWYTSQTRNQFVQTILKALQQRSSPIKKIVCIGLGQLRKESSWFSSVLQHIASFTIADALDIHNTAQFPKKSITPIEIVLQDPMYAENNRILLPELAERQLTFVKDLEGLLAIDQDSLVMTAFLPMGVPLMQILADLFRDGGGPAAMLGDKMALDPKREMYSFRVRGAPHVARWVRDEYVVHRPKWAPLGEALRGFSGQRVGSAEWLSEMELLVRK